jgi:hypothetical protein
MCLASVLSVVGSNLVIFMELADNGYIHAHSTRNAGGLD